MLMYFVVVFVIFQFIEDTGGKVPTVCRVLGRTWAFDKLSLNVIFTVLLVFMSYKITKTFPGNF
jgi:hypothetical protein